MTTTTRNRRALLTGAAAASVLHWTGAQAQQAYPNKPVRFANPAVPGGPSDIQGRLLADKLSQLLGQSFITDNRPGADGNVAMQVVATAPRDGYTIVIASVGTWAVNPNLFKAPFDIQRDIAPVVLLTSSPAVLVVNPNLPVKTVDDLIKLAKAKPGQLNFGSGGPGAIGHIAGVMFATATATSMVHVPYKSAAPANTDLIGGRIQLVFNTSSTIVPFVKSGQMRALAVTGNKRIRALPDLPSMAELGLPSVDITSWSGIGTTAGTPRANILKLNETINKILVLPDMQQKYAALGADITLGGTPERFAAFLQSEIAKYAKVIKDANITVS